MTMPVGSASRTVKMKQMTDDELLEAIYTGMQTVADRFRTKLDRTGLNPPPPPAEAATHPETPPRQNTRSRSSAA